MNATLLNAAPINAVGYVRLSKLDKGAESLSLEVQETRLRAYCDLNGLNLIQVFHERDVSGGIPFLEREQAALLFGCLERGEASNVVAVRLDRLFRDASDCLTTVRDWDRRGYGLHLLDMGGTAVNTRSAMGKMIISMMAAFAELERNMISERTTAVLQAKKARGEKLGGVAPYGYQIVKRPMPSGKPLSCLDVNPQQQDVIERMQAMRKRGETLFWIAGYLNSLGVPSSTGKRWQPEQIRLTLLRAASPSPTQPLARAKPASARAIPQPPPPNAHGQTIPAE